MLWPDTGEGWWNMNKHDVLSHALPNMTCIFSGEKRPWTHGWVSIARLDSRWLPPGVLDDGQVRGRWTLSWRSLPEFCRPTDRVWLLWIRRWVILRLQSGWHSLCGCRFLWCAVRWQTWRTRRTLRFRRTFRRLRGVPWLAFRWHAFCQLACCWFSCSRISCGWLSCSGISCGWLSWRRQGCAVCGRDMSWL